MLQTSSTFFFFCYDYYLLPPTRTSTESVRTLYSTPTSFNMSKYASFPHYELSLLLLKAHNAVYRNLQQTTLLPLRPASEEKDL
jgi:hypothetical protein